MAHDVTTRQYGTEPGDYQMVGAWYSAAHGGKPFPDMALPPHGVLASVDGEPLVALWVYLSYGIGVAHVHWALTKPDATSWKRMKALRAAMDWIENVSREHNCYLLFTTVRKRASCALRRIGFVSEGEQVFMTKALIQ